MRGIAADVNIEGHCEIFTQIWGSKEWQEIWSGLNLSVEWFINLSLSSDSTDAVVWQTCQKLELVLVTANRNRRGPDSLEETIRVQNTPLSLPVITIADAQRVMEDGAYAKRTAVRILDYLMMIENYRGAGRLYAP